VADGDSGELVEEVPEEAVRLAESGGEIGMQLMVTPLAVVLSGLTQHTEEENYRFLLVLPRLHIRRLVDMFVSFEPSYEVA
jgi:hypothetical protein